VANFPMERAAWERESGGPIEIICAATYGGEMVLHDPRRYLRQLPPGVKPGPHRVVHSMEVAAAG
jgi:hypothetical protein